ncbi:UDP-N-acetylmuramate dehydrogenase [Corticibacter populi]|uniref:UDP-N-acetylenolpyruvoylglucosamine reductase n=1 Tax=Corticibacter populi TaxID=1550736 RepID=A0A3M6QHU9_9BURK|nr:UDP-N-acetylmuramate dehydrogenase [Corticibacter populi]RMX02628.1 UDP-N-acetylmuramate dehydrogenase [Corticibacter populi]RZS32955.1 UDP-N-acetylmuramate dehydrogenase [Corticibacter populi]
MLVEKNVPLQSYNTFGIVAKARALVRIRQAQDLLSLAGIIQEQKQQAGLAPGKRLAPDLEPLVLGGGSNIVLTGDVPRLVLKMEIPGLRLMEENEAGWLVEAGAGERWHDLVRWTIEQDMPGLENMALIPGTVGAAPVQNIGAYGVELQDRLHSLDAVDLWTGRPFSLTAAQCAFGYRDSVFKHRPAGGPGPQEGDIDPATAGLGLSGRAVITRVRLWLPKPWQPVLDYLDLQRRMEQTGIQRPSPRQVFDWVVDIRRHKLPDPAVLGNAGSFFKNPTVTPEQCQDIIAREPRIVHYPMADGSFKLAAGWLIDACGWKGKMVGHAGVYEKQALVLVNLGQGEQGATGGEVMTLAKAIQTSVYERYGIRLEPEPVVV